MLAWGSAGQDGPPEGDLGDFTSLDSTNPVVAVGLSNAVNIASGAFHSLVIDARGNGGPGATTSRASWVMAPKTAGTFRSRCPGDERRKSAAGGIWHSLVVLTDGTILDVGSCQVPPRMSYHRLPSRGISNAVKVAAGSAHSLAVLADGSVWAWGANYAGQLGDGTGNDSPAPVNVLGLSNIVAVSALAIRTVWPWIPTGWFGHGVKW